MDPCAQQYFVTFPRLKFQISMSFVISQLIYSIPWIYTCFFTKPCSPLLYHLSFSLLLTLSCSPSYLPSPSSLSLSPSLSLTLSAQSSIKLDSQRQLSSLRQDEIDRSLPCALQPIRHDLLVHCPLHRIP